MSTFREILLVASIVIQILSVLPYIRDIVKGETRPNIVSWITWTLLTGVATVAEFAAHEFTTGLFTSGAVIETTLVVVFGLKYGYAKYTLFDALCQVGALLGFGLWYVFHSPMTAVLASVSIDFIGALPTVRHSWVSPNEETWVTYGLCCVAAVLGLLALDTYNWVSLPYPIYIVVINAVISAVIILRRKVGAFPLGRGQESC